MTCFGFHFGTRPHSAIITPYLMHMMVNLPMLIGLFVFQEEKDSYDVLYTHLVRNLTVLPLEKGIEIGIEISF